MTAGPRLNQLEVDRALGGKTDAPPRVVRPWNFARAPRLTRERRAVLDGILAGTARGWQTWMSSRLGSQATVTPAAIETLPFREVLASLDVPTSVFVFKLGGAASGSGILDLGGDFSSALLDRLLGGTGQPLSPRRAPTAVEQAMLRGPVERLLADFQNAWKERAALECAITSHTTTLETIAIAGPDEPALTFTLDARSGGIAGSVCFAVPLASLEPLLGRTSEPPLTPGALREPIARRLLDARVAIAVRMPAVRISARALAALEPGQILELGVPLDARAQLTVNGRPQFLGTLGQRRRRIGIRITQATAPGRTPAAFSGGNTR